jgi:hypothetical protein
MSDHAPILIQTPGSRLPEQPADSLTEAGRGSREDLPGCVTRSNVIIGVRAESSDVVWDEQVRQTFPSQAKVVRRIVADHRRRYRRLANSSLIFFRTVGSIEVILGVSFPLITLWTQQTVVLSGVSVAIAISAAMSNFFGWSQNWQLYRSQELMMDALVGRWNLRMLALLGEPSENTDKQRRATEVTEKLLTDVKKAREYHHNLFFDTLVRP